MPGITEAERTFRFQGIQWIREVRAAFPRPSLASPLPTQLIVMDFFLNAKPPTQYKRPEPTHWTANPNCTGNIKLSLLGRMGTFIHGRQRTSVSDKRSLTQLSSLHPVVIVVYVQIYAYDLHLFPLRCLVYDRANATDSGAWTLRKQTVVRGR